VELAAQAVKAAIKAPNQVAAANAMEIANAHINKAVAPFRRSTRATREPDWLNGRRPIASSSRVQKGNGEKKATRRSRGALAHVEAAAQAINAAANMRGADVAQNLEVAHAHLGWAAEVAGEEVPHVELAAQAVEAAIKAPNQVVARVSKKRDEYCECTYQRSRSGTHRKVGTYQEERCNHNFDSKQ
jgi:hypothetical protein